MFPQSIEAPTIHLTINSIPVLILPHHTHTYTPNTLTHPSPPPHTHTHTHTGGAHTEQWNEVRALQTRGGPGEE